MIYTHIDAHTYINKYGYTACVCGGVCVCTHFFVKQNTETKHFTKPIS